MVTVTITASVWGVLDWPLGDVVSGMLQTVARKILERFRIERNVTKFWEGLSRFERRTYQVFMSESRVNRGLVERIITNMVSIYKKAKESHRERLPGWASADPFGFWSFWGAVTRYRKQMLPSRVERLLVEI